MRWSSLDSAPTARIQCASVRSAARARWTASRSPATRGPNVAAAEEAYDRSSSCGFTSLVAYERSGARMLSNLHRNVIFRSSQVPALPISHQEPTAEGLWAALAKQCIDGGDREERLRCAGHPAQLDQQNGNMFHVEDSGDEHGGGDEGREAA